ncbi:9080_t:CDS:2, partial [Dentiscutata heterogama]
RKYNINLKYLLLIELEGRKNDKIPIELWDIIELSSAQRRHTIKHTALRPNMDRIIESVQTVLQFEKKFKLKTRVLKALKVSYHITSKAGGTVKLREGDGTFEIESLSEAVKHFNVEWWLHLFNNRGINFANQTIQKELVNTSRNQGIVVEARILKALKVSYHKAGGTVKLREGGWNLRDRKFVRSKPNIQKELVNTSRNQGMVQT